MNDIITKWRKRILESKLFYKTWPNLRLLQYYLRSIPDWPGWQNKRRKAVQIFPKGSDQEKAQLHIAFVTDMISARELKLAYAVKLCGHRTSLILVSKPVTTSPDYFDNQNQCENIWQALSLLEELKPDVVHLFVHVANSYLLPIILYSNSPVVYDPYDCKRGFISPEIYYLEAAAERACYERSAHICSRSLEPLYLRRKFGYKSPGTTYFPEYCWNTPLIREDRQISSDQELHVVYGGGVMPEDRFPASIYGYAQYLEVGRLLAEQKIHLHIYPAPIKEKFEDYFSLYLKESRLNPFFHIHRSLPTKDWIGELSRFDAALHIFGSSINGKFDHANEAKQNYSSANKLIDYLEAGLPVLIHGGFHQHGLLRHYRHAVKLVEIKEAREKLTTFLNARPVINLNSTTLLHQAHRLSEMYHNLVS